MSIDRDHRPSNGTTFGGWITQPSTIVVEAFARSGFDCVTLDMQHGALDFRDVVHATQILDLLGINSYVRLSVYDLATVPRLLDFGLSGVIVASVDDKESAERAVTHARYQPIGSRSYGGQRYGLRPEPERIHMVRPEVWVMIETSGGVANQTEISAVDGLAGLVVGPADLALALGLEVSKREDSADWHAAILRVLQTAKTANLGSWMFAANGGDAARWATFGFDRVTISSDVAILRGALAMEIATARGVAAERLATEL